MEVLRAAALAAFAAAPLAAPAQPTFDEVIYATVPVNGGTFNLPLDIYRATAGAGPHPVLLWIHGGGWSGGSHNVSPPGFVLDLRAQGITVVSVEYRLSGQAIFPAQVHDVKGAVRWLRAHATEYNLEPTRFGAWGTSAGNFGAADFRCAVSNACGSAQSDPRGLTVRACCDPDTNCDGALNGFDIQATESAVNGDFSEFCLPSADLNADGAENGFDVEIEEQRVNGAPC